MSNNAIITKNTGWMKPSRVAQDTRYGKVNKYTCYAYSQLDNIKADDGSCAYIPTSGGVNDTHRSAGVYCSGFGFNIPNNATITKVLIRQKRCMGTNSTGSCIKDNLIKLKIGDSTTDWGTGNNLSAGVLWNTKKQGLGYYTAGDKSGTVYTVWGVNLTPATINNQHFGCVVQCIGTTKKWYMPKIDCIDMCVYYTQVNNSTTAPDTTSNKENIKSEPKAQSKNIESKIVTEYQPDDSEILDITSTEISEDYLYTPFSVWVQYRNYLESGSHVLEQGYNGVITLTLNDKLRFIDGTRTMKIPAFDFKQVTDSKDIQRGYKTIFKEVHIYPVTAGGGTLTVTGVNFKDGSNTVTTQTLNFTVASGKLALNDSQMVLSNISFYDCEATKGSAIYNFGSMSIIYATFADLSSTDKVFYDYDKYRDCEFR